MIKFLSLRLILEVFRPKRGLNPALEDENDPLIAIVQKLREDVHN